MAGVMTSLLLTSALEQHDYLTLSPPSAQRFGRFPGRNALLCRQSSEEEEAWLSSADCPGWARPTQIATFAYWRGRGLGDQVRFLLEFTLTPYTQETVDSPDAFADLKASGDLAFGQVPLLRIDGMCLVQTQAILRHVARRRKLVGETQREMVTADMVVNGILDARMPLVTARFSSKPDEALGHFGRVTLPRLLGHIETILKQGGGPYVCGSRLTYADCSLFELLVYSIDECAAETELALSASPHVASHYALLGSMPHMKEFLSSSRRHPPPDEAFVRRVCSTLSMDLPGYLSRAPSHAELLRRPRYTAAMAIAAAAIATAVALRAAASGKR